VNRFVTTLQEASTVIAEQDSNLKLIKWAVKVRDTPCFMKRKDSVNWRKRRLGP